MKRTISITPAHRAALQKKWIENIKDLTIPVPLRMPPMREVVHEINWIDPTYKLIYRPPRCPDSLKTQLLEKIERYTTAGWWTSKSVASAAPMLCLPKKDEGLRTVVDNQKQNDNTVKDVTPFPDQDNIRHDVARGRFRTKLDMSDAYEQIRIRESDVEKTAFATIYGTFVSNVMVQGDCNAPSTFQRFMTHTFRDYIGRFAHVYMDDIFIYSDTIEEHEQHLSLVFNRLREKSLFLSKRKVDILTPRMDCLGHIIDDDGIHVDQDKMQKVRAWRTPRDYNDVQRYLGLVQYLAQFMPNITDYTAPLSGMIRHNRLFVWSALHDKCFEMIKQIACKTPILRPVDPRDKTPIWVVCDASASGIGAFYGQGQEWYKSRPAGFLSKKFTPAQRNYYTWEQEMIAILEALLKWEDKLIGIPITIVTDHKALTFFKTKTNMSGRQVRWWEFLSRFNYTLVYTKGSTNKVADALSRYYMNDTPGEKHDLADYVNADVRIDSQGDYLTEGRRGELVNGLPSLVHAGAARKIKPQRGKTKGNNAPKIILDNPNKPASNRPPPRIADDQTIDLAIKDSSTKDKNPLVKLEQSSEFLTQLRDGYKSDVTLSKVINALPHFKDYWLEEGLLYKKSRTGKPVMCVPNARLNKRRIQEMLISESHGILGHLGPDHTIAHLRQWFWWSTLVRDTNAFCDTCGRCQVAKHSNQKPTGLLHSLPLPSRPWESIGIDFMGPLPDNDGYDYVMVVICRLSSMVHLIACSSTVKATEVAMLYYREIVRLHGLPDSIVSDRDPRFTSKFWAELHRISGTRLLMSTAHHPQTDGASERAIRSVNQILRSIIDDDQENWKQKLTAVEFAINSSINGSSKITPFEINYGWLPTMITGFTAKSPFTGVQEFADRAIRNIDEAHDALIASRIDQTHHANKRRREEPVITTGSKVYLSTANLSLPKGRVRRLLPKYIGPYVVTKSDAHNSNYTLDLPPELLRRHVHPTFHVNKLRPYRPNDDLLFPGREAQVYYDFGEDPEMEWLVDEIVDHRRNPKLQFNVQWTYGDNTWETLDSVNELEALDRYLELHGVKLPSELSH